MESQVLELLKEQGGRLENIESLLTISKTILNLDEVCSFTGLSKSHLYKLTMRGGIPHYKQAKHLFFDRVEVEKWLKTNRSKTSEEIEKEANTFVTLNRKGGQK